MRPLTQQLQVRGGLPLGRHTAAIALIAVLTLVFSWVHRNPSAEDLGLSLSNRVMADTSLVLLCLILMLGAIARLVPRLRPVMPWARELGIGMFVTACLHVLMLLDDGWDVIPFFAERTHLGIELVPDGFLAANWVGLVALAYALVLAVTSNDVSQRRLGRGWKFLQRQTYTLFVLAWLHTAGFLFFNHLEGNSFIPWFWAFTLSAGVAQLAGFFTRCGRRGGPHFNEHRQRTVLVSRQGVALRWEWQLLSQLYGSSSYQSSTCLSGWFKELDRTRITAHMGGQAARFSRTSFAGYGPVTSSVLASVRMCRSGVS